MEDKLPDPDHGGPPQSIVEAAAAVVTVRLVSIILVVYAQFQGLAILIGGRKRFSESNTAYEIAISFPGGQVSWGLSLFLAGVFGMYAVSARKRRMQFVTFSFISAWSLAFGLCFARAAAVYPSATVTGIWVYVKDAAFMLVMSAVLFSNHYRREHDA